MKKLVISLIFLMSFSFVSAKDQVVGNLYSRWARLSLLGKTQSEIEYSLRNIKETIIEKVKVQLRLSVIHNLRRQGIKRIVALSNDIDDLNTASNIISTEIRFAGLENDDDLRLSIKEEFGFYFESL